MREMRSLAFAVWAILMIALSARASAQTRREDNPGFDTQVWPDVNVTIKLRPDLRLAIFGTVRIGRNVSVPFSQQIGAGLLKSFGNNLNTAIWYRYVDSETAPDRQSREHRVFFDLTPRAPLPWGITMSDRNRIEWRDINDRISWRYRNRLQFERPLSLGERKLTPYIAGETAYDSRFHTLTRSQAFAGMRIPLNDHVTFDGFYMRQFDARSKPGFLHVIGAFWRVEF